VPDPDEKMVTVYQSNYWEDGLEWSEMTVLQHDRQQPLGLRRVVPLRTSQKEIPASLWERYKAACDKRIELASEIEGYA